MDNKESEMYSPKFTLTAIDREKFLHNATLFLAPLVVIYLSAVIAEINNDGFQLVDFIPNTVVIGSLVLYVLNTTLDFLRKFVPEKYN